VVVDDRFLRYVPKGQERAQPFRFVVRKQIEYGIAEVALDATGRDSTTIGEVIRLHKLRLERGFDSEIVFFGC
jgi:hypothetical protein